MPVPKLLTSSRESVDSQPDRQVLRIHLVRYSRAISVAGGIASRNPCSAPPTECAERQIVEARSRQQCRSLGVCRSIAWHHSAGRPKDPPAGSMMCWHHPGFLTYWRRKSRRRDRPRIPSEPSPAHSRDERCHPNAPIAEKRRAAYARRPGARARLSWAGPLSEQDQAARWGSR